MAKGKNRRQNALQKNSFKKWSFFLTQTNFFPVPRPLVAPFVIACHKLVARAEPAQPCQVELETKAEASVSAARRKAPGKSVPSLKVSGTCWFLRHWLKIFFRCRENLLFHSCEVDNKVMALKKSDENLIDFSYMLATSRCHRVNSVCPVHLNKAS